MRGKQQTTYSNLCNEVQNSQKKGGRGGGILIITDSSKFSHLGDELGVYVREAPGPGLGPGPRTLRGPLLTLGQRHPPDHRPETEKQ